MVYTKTINDSMIINFDYVYHHLLSRINVLRDRPFNLKRGGGYGFCFVQNFFFEQHKSQNIYFFCSAQREICFQHSTLCYMAKTLNQIIFFFLHQNQNICLEKTHNPPSLQVKWSFPNMSLDNQRKITLILKRDKRKSIYVLIHQFKRT